MRPTLASLITALLLVQIGCTKNRKPEELNLEKARARVTETQEKMSKSGIQLSDRMKLLFELKDQVTAWIDRTPNAKFAITPEAIPYVYDLNSVLRRVEPIYQRKMEQGACVDVANEIESHSLREASNKPGAQAGLKIITLVCFNPPQTR